MARRKTKGNDVILIQFIIGIIVIMLSIIAIFKLGLVGVWLSNCFVYLFGNLFIVQLIFVILGVIYFLFLKEKHVLKLRIIIGLIVINLAIMLILSSSANYSDGMAAIGEYIGQTIAFFNGTNTISVGGGIIGVVVFALASAMFAKQGALVVAITLLIIGLLLVASLDFYRNLFFAIKDKTVKIINNINLNREVKNKQKQSAKAAMAQASVPQQVNVVQQPVKKTIFIDSDVPTIIEDKPTKVDNNNDDKVKSSASKLNNKNYVLPPTNLLDQNKAKQKNSVNETSAKIKGQKVIEILNNFGIKADLMATHIGPSVTKFEVKPDSSVKVSKINNIQDNIKMELAARDIRIEAPIPGRNAVGIEIPNVESVPVKMIDLIKQVPVDKQNKKLLFVLGKDLMGQPVFCELDRMPHLLVAGATGSGKSVCMNSIITSLLLRTKPDEVKLLLIDPKKVEFTPYHKIPHLIGPVISDAQEASNALKIIVEMMEARFDLFAKVGVRNIQAYNEKVEQNPDEKLQKMPFIVVIIDELADLMATSGKEVEVSIQRITQLARASGIHLIVATQRPSTDVITGIIKSNIPSRIAFAVASGIDSRTIIDSVGAERLLGHGDMLYLPIGEPSAVRLQGVYVSDHEVKVITDFVKAEGIPLYDDAFIRLEGVTSSEDNAVLRANDDPLYDEIKAYVIDQQKASTSLLQRRFGIGYNRAARMIDVLEENGIVGPIQGSKPRVVYMKKEEQIDE